MPDTKVTPNNSIPASILPSAPKIEKENLLKGYASKIDKDKMKSENYPEASWAEIIKNILEQGTPDKAMDVLLMACLVFPIAYAAYTTDLYLEEKKEKIKYIDQKAALWNASMRKLKGLSESDVLQAIQGDFLYSPQGLIARYNEDVYQGLTSDNGRYTGQQEVILSKRIADKENSLRQTNPELFKDLFPNANGVYSQADAEVFRIRYLMYMHPDLLSGIQKDPKGKYSESDINLFKERLLVKNFAVIYERMPTVRERKGLIGGFTKTDQIIMYAPAQKGIYGLRLGIKELESLENKLHHSITNDFKNAWDNLRTGKNFFGMTKGKEKASVEIPTAIDSLLATYTSQNSQPAVTQMQDSYRQMATLFNVPLEYTSMAPNVATNASSESAPKAPDPSNNVPLWSTPKAPSLSNSASLKTTPAVPRGNMSTQTIPGVFNMPKGAFSKTYDLTQKDMEAFYETNKNQEIKNENISSMKENEGVASPEASQKATEENMEAPSSPAVLSVDENGMASPEASQKAAEENMEAPSSPAVPSAKENEGMASPEASQKMTEEVSVIPETEKKRGRKSTTGTKVTRKKSSLKDACDDLNKKGNVLTMKNEKRTLAKVIKELEKTKEKLTSVTLVLENMKQNTEKTSNKENKQVNKELKERGNSL